MKNKIKILVLAGLLSSSVYAQSDLYFGIGFNKTTLKKSVNISGANYVLKYKNNNYKALIGKRLSDSMAIELQYGDLAKENITANNVATVVAMSGSSIGVAGLYHFNPQSDFSPFVKLGAHSWDAKVINNTTGDSAKTDGTDVFYGVGVDGKINDNMKFRLEFERMKIDSDDIENIGVGLLFDF
jgi:outer membrane protein W